MIGSRDDGKIMITVKKDFLLEKLKENLRAHVENYKKANASYVE